LSGKVAYIFPGQGSQYVGMGKDLYDKFPHAKEIFDGADKILGYSLKELCFEGPKEKLSTTRYSQPAIFTASVAALRALESEISNLEVTAALGLSLGEYTALASAGSIDFEDALRLVAARGEYMDDASRENPGKMASILGIDREKAEGICSEAQCEIANLNCPGQIVISGTSDSIEKATGLAKERGAKRTIILDVSGAFHSSMMKPASDRLKTMLDKTEIKKPTFRIVSNVDAGYHTEDQDIRKNLLAQLTGRTYWEDSIRLVAKDGVRTFLEIGPGKVLKGLLRRIDPDLTVHNADTAEDISNLREAILC